MAVRLALLGIAAKGIECIATSGSPILQSLQTPAVSLVHLPPLPSFLASLPSLFFLLLAPVKLLWQAYALCYTVLSSPPTELTLVQNPPALPTLPIIQFCCLMNGSKLIVDWHNTGASILAIRLGPSHPIVKLASWLEGFFGQKAYAHLFVTNDMKDYLSFKWSLQGKQRVFYDRPPSSFRRISDIERVSFFNRLPHLAPPPSWSIAISSTSWTADEDFSILLNSLSLYNQSATSGLLVIITGKGPLKAQYEVEVARRRKDEKWNKVDIRMVWLEREDYPLLLGSADFGISLHESSSGFDLPMKVVDMFGCELPVLALNFAALGELVKDGINGYTFVGYKDLADHLLTLTASNSKQELDRLRQGIQTASYGTSNTSWSDWSTEWDRVILPLLQS